MHRKIQKRSFSVYVISILITVLSGFTSAMQVAKPLHVFLESRLSPDAKKVVSIEGDSSPQGGPPVIRSLVIRTVEQNTTTIVQLPCGQTRQCWPSSPVWTSDSTKITFALRTPGSHARSIYQVDADGAGLKELLSFNGTIDALRYSAEGQLAMLATEGAAKESGAVEAAAPITGDINETTPERRIAILTNGKLNWASPANLFVYEFDWTPDGKGFIGTAAEGDGDRNWWVARLYGFNAANAKATVLYTPANKQQQIANPRVSRDGKRIAFIGGIMSDFGSTGGDIFIMPSTGGKPENITSDMRASATALDWSCDGHVLAKTLAGDKNQLVDFGTPLGNKATKILWQGQSSIHFTEGNLAGNCPSGMTAITAESFNTAPEIAIGKAGEWKNLTNSNSSYTDLAYTVQSLSWTSDSFTVQGWLILPPRAPGQIQFPMITVVHGGPAAAAQPAVLAPGRLSVLLNHGYAIFLPNPRGSFGQGEAFTLANVRDFGQGDLRDILAGVDKAIKSAPIDPKRLGITGHSYGGFMTMWAVTQTNRFKAAVAGAGIANWQSYYGQNGIDEWMTPYFGSSVYDDPAPYLNASPINFVRNVQTPTLSAVGSADIECPAPQTLEFGHALKKLGVPSSTIIYPDEGHRFNNPANISDLQRRTLDWFDRYLK